MARERKRHQVEANFGGMPPAGIQVASSKKKSVERLAILARTRECRGHAIKTVSDL